MIDCSKYSIFLVQVFILEILYIFKGNLIFRKYVGLSLLIKGENECKKFAIQLILLI